MILITVYKAGARSSSFDRQKSNVSNEHAKVERVIFFVFVLFIKEFKIMVDGEK